LLSRPTVGTEFGPQPLDAHAGAEVPEPLSLEAPLAIAGEHRTQRFDELVTRNVLGFAERNLRSEEGSRGASTIDVGTGTGTELGAGRVLTGEPGLEFRVDILEGEVVGLTETTRPSGRARLSAR